MADDWKGKVTREPFPEIPGMPNRNELMKPLIFPNSQRGFKIFIVVATISKYLVGMDFASIKMKRKITNALIAVLLHPF